MRQQGSALRVALISFCWCYEAAAGSVNVSITSFYIFDPNFGRWSPLSSSNPFLAKKLTVSRCCFFASFSRDRQENCGSVSTYCRSVRYTGTVPYLRCIPSEMFVKVKLLLGPMSRNDLMEEKYFISVSRRPKTVSFFLEFYNIVYLCQHNHVPIIIISVCY